MSIAVPTTSSDWTYQAATAQTSPFACNKPINTATNDYLVAWVALRNASATVTPPSGWTQFGPVDNSNQTAQAFYKLITNGGTEPSTYSWTFTGGSNTRAFIVIFRVTGANQSSFLDVAGTYSGITGTSSVVLPGLTTTVNNDLLLGFAVALNSSASGPIFTAPSGFTKLNGSPVGSETVANGTTSMSVGVFFKAAGSAGATGNQSAAMAPSASSSQGFLLSLRPPSGPTASFTYQTIGTDVVLTDTSTAASPASISSRAWTFGDSASSSATNPTHQYAAAATYTVGLTVTDSNGVTASTSQSVVITGPGGGGLITAASGTGWTAVNAADLNTALTDSTGGGTAPNVGTFVVSSVGPSGQQIIFNCPPVATPAVPVSATFTLWLDRVASTSGTWACQLFEGGASGTQRSAVTGLSIPDMTATGGAGDATSGSVSTTAGVTASFPWSDISVITDWNQLVVKAQFTAA